MREDKEHHVIMLEIKIQENKIAVEEVWTAFQKTEENNSSSISPTYASQTERLGFFSSNFTYGSDWNCPGSKYIFLALYGSAKEYPIECLAVIDTEADNKELVFLDSTNYDLCKQHPGSLFSYV